MYRSPSGVAAWKALVLSAVKAPATEVVVRDKAGHTGRARAAVLVSCPVFYLRNRLVAQRQQQRPKRRRIVAAARDGHQILVFDAHLPPFYTPGRRS